MKKLIFKLVLLAVVVFFLQSLLTRQFLRSDDIRLEKYVYRFNEFTRLNIHLAKKTDIVFLGDSSVYTVIPADNDKQTIAEMVDGMMPGLTLVEISHAAYHMELYLEFCRYISRQANRPKIVIIPINMGTFSAEWDMRPEYQFEKEKIILRGGFKKHLVLAFSKPLAVFKYNFFPITRKEYLEAPVFRGGEQVGKVEDFNHSGFKQFTRQNIKKKIISRYMYTLKQEHRKVKALVEVAEVLKRCNIRALVYIVPVDHETCDSYFPGEFNSRLTGNVELIRSLLAARGIKLLDLSSALPADVFVYGNYPDEHVKENGRRRVAERISAFLAARSEFKK